MASMASCGPVSASTAATCENDEVQLTLLMMSRLNTGTSSGGTMA